MTTENFNYIAISDEEKNLLSYFLTHHLIEDNIQIFNMKINNKFPAFHFSNSPSSLQEKNEHKKVYSFLSNAIESMHELEKMNNQYIEILTKEQSYNNISDLLDNYKENNKILRANSNYLNSFINSDNFKGL